MDAPLTRRQREIYEHLIERADRGEPPPTLDELARALGLRSRGSLHKHVQALIDAGLVEPFDGRRRGVRLAHRPEPPETQGGGVALPLLGRIAAGRPIEAIELPDTVEVPASMTGRGERYVLEVRGDSMIDEGILDGDRVVVEHRDHADNGEIVVALIDGEEATLKRIEQRPGEVVLHPANADLAPITYEPDRVRIQGRVVGLLRSYGAPR